MFTIAASQYTKSQAITASHPVLPPVRARMAALSIAAAQAAWRRIQRANPGTPERARISKWALWGARSERSAFTWKPSASARLIPKPLPVQKYGPSIVGSW